LILQLYASKPGSFGKPFGLGNGALSSILRYLSLTFHEQPELIRRYRDWVINFPDAENVFQSALAVFKRTDITEFLPRIVVPALAISGSEDPATMPGELQVVAERIRNARPVVIEQASHLVTLEKPREVAAVMRSFIQELKLGSK
jgi:3-oxoadipate enol-lactonase